MPTSLDTEVVVKVAQSLLQKRLFLPVSTPRHDALFGYWGGWVVPEMKKYQLVGIACENYTQSASIATVRGTGGVPSPQETRL